MDDRLVTMQVWTKLGDSRGGGGHAGRFYRNNIAYSGLGMIAMGHGRPRAIPVSRGSFLSWCRLLRSGLRCE